MRRLENLQDDIKYKEGSREAALLFITKKGRA